LHFRQIAAQSLVGRNPSVIHSHRLEGPVMAPRSSMAVGESLVRLIAAGTAPGPAEATQGCCGCHAATANRTCVDIRLDRRPGGQSEHGLRLQRQGTADPDWRLSSWSLPASSIGVFMRRQDAGP